MVTPLELRPIDDGDLDLVFDLFSRPEVARWSGTGQPLTTRDEAAARLERYQTRGADHPAAGIFVVTPAGGAPAGVALLVLTPASAGFDNHDFEIGWHLLPQAWGHGYATRAARELIERARQSGIDQLIAVTDPDNVRSQAVCARLGMTDLGLRPDWYDRSLRAFSLDLRSVG